MAPDISENLLDSVKSVFSPNAEGRHLDDLGPHLAFPGLSLSVLHYRLSVLDYNLLIPYDRRS